MKRNLKRRLQSVLWFLRVRSGMTQTEVAKKLGIAQTRLSSYECGKTGLSLSILSKLKSLYGVSYEALISHLKTSFYIDG